MKYDDNTYLDHDEDDLWDDELDLTSTGPRRVTEDTDDLYSPAADTHADQYEPSYAEANESNDYYSDPMPERVEPKPEPQPKPNTEPSGSRRGFFRRKSDEEEEETDNDYYDSDSEPAPRKPKAPKLDPEDPDYWISDKDDSPLTGITSVGGRWKWQLGAVVSLIVLAIGIWAWFFRPYADSAVTYGYIRNMERRGLLFKTFEGTMIPYKELGDPDPLFFQTVPFSVESDSIAAMMKRMMLGCVPVRVEYETYHTPLPWKGDSKMVIIKADTADVSKILPPEYQFNDK